MKFRLLILISLLNHGSKLAAEGIPPFIAAIIKDKTPETQVKLLDSIAYDLRDKDFRSALKVYHYTKQLAKKTDQKKSVVKAYLSLSLAYRRAGIFDTALVYVDSANAFAIEHKITKQYANIADYEGLTYMRMGNYEKATACFYKCIKFAEEYHDSLKLYQGFEHIGTVNFYRRDYNTSVKFYKQALRCFPSTGTAQAYFLTLDNIGLAYSNSNTMDSALLYQKRAVGAIEKINDSTVMAESYLNIGSTLLVMKRFHESEPYFSRAFKINALLNNASGIQMSNLHLGRLYLESGNPKKALPYLETAHELALKLKVPPKIKESLSALTEGYAAIGDYKKSSEYSQELVAITDKIYEEENSKAINELSTQYETEKKQREIQLLTSERELQLQRIEKDKYVKLFIAALAIFLLVLSLIFIYRFRKKKKDNRILLEKNEAIAAQKEKIEVQKELLLHKNKEITDSINYARRIQSSVLPSINLVKKLLPESFIYFKPKDIVSGDFYWTCESNGYVFCAVSDCTGHGVPGAMMSMLGASLLNQIVLNAKVESPSEILKELHYHILKTLNENMDHQESKDGMDIALIRIDNKNKTVQYAGAGRPLYLVKNSKLIAYKPDKHAIGSSNESSEMRSYTLHTISFSEPTQFYLFSDGIPDQFGGEKGKKLMTKNLLVFLEKTASLPLPEQEKQFAQFFEIWKKGVEQTDDVTLISIRLS